MSEEEQFTGPTKWGNPFKNPRGQQQIVLRGKGRATNHLNLKLHIKLMATIFISAWKTANAGPRGKGYKFDHTFKLVCKQTIQYFMTCENCFHPKFDNQEMVVLHIKYPISTFGQVFEEFYSTSNTLGPRSELQRTNKTFDLSG